MIIIVLHGPMGSGKSTIAKLIAERFHMHGKDCEVIPFAKPLKDAFKALGWNGEKDEKGRRGLQLLGTEVGRECISPTIWSDKWLRAVQASEADVIICDDLRFYSEYDAIEKLSREHTVVTVKIKGRGYATGGLWKRIIYTIRSWLGLLHASERPIADHLFNMIFVNDKSIYHLEQFVEQLYYRVK